MTAQSLPLPPDGLFSVFEDLPLKGLDQLPDGNVRGLAGEARRPSSHASPLTPEESLRGRSLVAAHMPLCPPCLHLGVSVRVLNLAVS